jgi:hypothetical protein
MGFSEINRTSDVHSNHVAPTRRDLLRLIAEGKRPALPQENEILVGEDGKPLEKLQLDPERECLLGGMPRGDQGSTSRLIRAEDLARMSTDEQIIWCLDGGLADALGPDGDKAFVPVIFNILENNQIANWVRKGAADGLGTIAAATNDSTIKQKLLETLENNQIGDSVRRGCSKGSWNNSSCN